MAALDRRIYEKLTPLVSEIIRLSEQADDAIASSVNAGKHSQDGVTQANQAALAYVKSLPRQIADLIGYDGQSAEGGVL